jgi:hypothetical protein
MSSDPLAPNEPHSAAVSEGSEPGKPMESGLQPSTGNQLVGFIFISWHQKNPPTLHTHSFLKART